MAVPATSAPPQLTGGAGRRLTALTVAAVLFLGRVVAQLIQSSLNVAWLPSVFQRFTRMRRP